MVWFAPTWRRLVIVSPALALMLALGGMLVPPDGCSVVAIEEDGSALATCPDRPAWFVYNPDEAGGGRWTEMRGDLPGFALPSPGRRDHVRSG